MAKNKDIEKTIEKRVKRKLDNIDLTNNTEIEKKLDHIIEEEILIDLENRAKEEVDETIGVPEKSTEFTMASLLPDFSRHFDACWSEGNCKIVLFVMSVAYLLVGLSMLLCLLFNAPYCINRTIFGGSPYFIFISVLSIVLIILISYKSKHKKTAILFGFFLQIPILILMLFTIVRIVALVIIAFVLLRFITQGRG